MGIGEPKMQTPEEMAEIQKQRALSDAELIKDGAEYEFNKQGNSNLELTEEQKATIKEEQIIKTEMEGQSEEFKNKWKERGDIYKEEAKKHSASEDSYFRNFTMWTEVAGCYLKAGEIQEAKNIYSMLGNQAKEAKEKGNASDSLCANVQETSANFLKGLENGEIINDYYYRDYK